MQADPSNGIETRPALPPDALAVTELADRFFREEAFQLPAEGLRPRVERYLGMEGHGVFVAQREQRVIGFATVATGFGLEYGWVAELEDLYVLPDERSRGVARRLVDLAVRWAGDRGCSAVLVTVTPEGERSHTLSEFYGRVGFHDRGRRLLERPTR